MQGVKKARGARKVRVVIAMVCTIGPLIFAGAIATGAIGGSDASPGDEPDGVDDGNPYQETVPCTGPEEPVNFEVFSAGPSVAGLPFTGNSRRCDTGVPANGWPNNYVSYFYGDCEIPEGATGCALPLEIQTWPACQRSKDDYTFEGKPLPYRKLPKQGGAEVVEFNFPTDRIEVYTRSATIVIFATEPDLARKVVPLLRPQEKGNPPATKAEALRGTPPEGLAPPSDGSMEGVLPCQS
jgi:hypothetical protein